MPKHNVEYEGVAYSADYPQYRRKSARGRNANNVDIHQVIMHTIPGKNSRGGKTAIANAHHATGNTGSVSSISSCIGEPVTVEKKNLQLRYTLSVATDIRPPQFSGRVYDDVDQIVQKFEVITKD